MRFQITSPAEAVVGRYQLYVETKTKINDSDKPEEFRYHYSDEIIVLFNPWCKGKVCEHALTLLPRSCGLRCEPVCIHHFFFFFLFWRKGL